MTTSSSSNHCNLPDANAASAAEGAATSATKTLVVVATYNEIENLPKLIDEVFSHAPGVSLLVIDDNSPDGTGKWCSEKAASDPRVRCIHRTGKLGLGTATIAGLKYAVAEKFDLVVTMDADFSHHPRYIPSLVAGILENSQSPRDVVIGSRYVHGGGIEGWPITRHLMSRAVNAYARLLLGLQSHDCSGAFRCYRISVLRKIDLQSIRSRGYSYLEEILWNLRRAGATFYEVPIVFVERQSGRSKINIHEAFNALWIIFRLGVKNWIGV